MTKSTTKTMQGGSFENVIAFTKIAYDPKLKKKWSGFRIIIKYLCVKNLKKTESRVIEGGSFLNQKMFKKSQDASNIHSDAVGFRLSCKQKRTDDEII